MVSSFGIANVDFESKFEFYFDRFLIIYYVVQSRSKINPF